MKSELKEYRYFILSAILVIADQVTKFLIVKYVPIYTVAWSFGGDFFNLIHVRNTGAAFSMGDSLPGAVRGILLIIIPVVILTAVIVYTVRSKELSPGQKWVLSGIVGGGFGNQIDRIFRPEGVVDFLDFKFYGIFGLERWPTFNIADASLVVSSCLLIFLMFRQEILLRKETKKDPS